LTYDPIGRRITVIEEDGIIHTLDIITDNNEENKEEKVKARGSVVAKRVTTILFCYF
jgi:DNA-binding protein